METIKPTSPGSVRRRAILFVLSASFVFSCTGALIKSVAGEIPTGEIVVCRSVIAGLLLMPLLQRRGGLGLLLRTRHPWGHVGRTVSGFLGMTTSYYGYGHLPLATNTALGFAMPLVLTILSVPLLGERVGPRRIAGVLVGLAGVLIMVRPWNHSDGGLPLFPVSVVLFGVVMWAFSMIGIRRLGGSGEPNEVIVMWYSIGASLMGLVIAVPVWVTPAWPELLGLIGVGALSAIAQMLMTEGYRTGEAALVSPFEYGAIIYTTIFGLVIWHEVPDLWNAVGILVLVGSGLYVWSRETRTG